MQFSKSFKIFFQFTFHSIPLIKPWEDAPNSGVTSWKIIKLIDITI